MTKRENIMDMSSCWNKALDGEILFILRQIDEATPNTIRFWVRERIKLGQNKPTDEKIIMALALAAEIENLRGLVDAK